MLTVSENTYRRPSSYILRWLMGPASILDGLTKTLTLGFVYSDLTYRCTILILERESE